MIRRVLHVVPDMVPYGLERVVASLVTLCDGERYQSAIATLYSPQDGGLDSGLERDGVRVFAMGKKRGFDVRMYSRFTRVLREWQPDIVHTHNYVLRYTLAPSLALRVPAMVHTIHNVADREVDSLGRWLQRFAFRGMVQPVAIAQEVVRTYAQVYGGPEPPLIPNGIPVDRYAKGRNARQAWRKAEGFSDAELLFVCLARLYPQKNHATLLEAFATVSRRVPEARLLLAGDGDLRADLERQAAGLGIGSRVRFLGRREDVPETLGAADVFVLASLWEGNPLSVMEAMAAGLPVAVTAVGGVPELVGDDRSGFVVRAGDAEQLAAAMIQLAEDPGRRASIGRAAQRRAYARFDERAMVAAYEELYDRLTGRAAKVRAAA